MNAPIANQLRQETGFLRTVLGDAIRETSGDEAFEIVEELRQAAKASRHGHAGTDRQIKQLVSGLDDKQLRIAIRAFTVLLDLLNLVEDRRRVQVLAERARQAYPQPRNESIRDAIHRLKKAGLSAAAVQSLVDQLHIELVFTAHPTEAKRRSVRSKVRAIRNLMQQYDSEQLPEDRDRTEEMIRAEITRLWQTDFIRPWRPSVMREVGRGFSVKPVLWDTVPRIASDLGDALQTSYGDQVHLKHPCLPFGSRIGGDRDGRPGVTPAEYHESCRAILSLTEQNELLDGTPWLKESIRVRNRFIDPLNLIQVELLRRSQSETHNENDAEELRHLTRLSINGIAVGMRTSG